jgi:hypothetical protein
MDIGISGDQWKLHFSSEDKPISPNYITLSYRWGSKPCLKLIRSNMHQLRRGQPISQLPLTFRDAIFVARRFSIQYLWIDSICIVQDSAEDWEQEAGMMRDVYANSALSISAIASINPDSGLFRSREARDIQPGILKGRYDGLADQNYYILERNYRDRQLTDTQLNRRGWVLQERLLAPRVLHFTQKQIFWECFTDNKCEVFSLGLPYHWPLKDFSSLFSDSQRRYSLEDNSRMPKDVFRRWQQIVEEYSQCELTIPNDKLPALSGIARLFQEATADTYLAGLWKSRLRESLTWAVRKPAAKMLSSQYRSPSWSWASIDGAVYAEVESNVSLISIIDANTTTTTIDTTGRVSAGYLVVEGVLLEAMYHQTDVKGHHIWRGNGSLQIGDHNLRIRTSADSLDALAKDRTPVSCLIMECVSTRSIGSWVEGVSEEGLFRVTGLFLTRVYSPICEYKRISLFEFEMSAKVLLEKFGICITVTGNLKDPKATQASWSDAIVTEHIRII